jgi:hypothetical protein
MARPFLLFRRVDGPSGVPPNCAREGMPLGRRDLQCVCCQRAAGVPDLHARAGLPLGRRNMQCVCCERAAGVPDLYARAGLPLDRRCLHRGLCKVGHKWSSALDQFLRTHEACTGGWPAVHVGAAAGGPLPGGGLEPPGAARGRRAGPVVQRDRHLRALPPPGQIPASAGRARRARARAGGVADPATGGQRHHYPHAPAQGRDSRLLRDRPRVRPHRRRRTEAAVRRRAHRGPFQDQVGRRPHGRGQQPQGRAHAGHWALPGAAAAAVGPREEDVNSAVRVPRLGGPGARGGPDGRAHQPGARRRGPTVTAQMRPTRASTHGITSVAAIQRTF